MAHPIVLISHLYMHRVAGDIWLLVYDFSRLQCAGDDGLNMFI